MRRVLAPWWGTVCASSFLAYFLLLLHCDVWRPVPEGLAVEPVAGQVGLRVTGVTPGSPAERAGIRTGDVILAADNRAVGSRIEWEAVQANVSFDRPVSLEVRRGSDVRRAEWVVTRAGWEYWGRREGVDLLVTRLAQLVTLGLGLVVLFKRPHDRGARLGGWLLATFGVFCIALPYRMADVWRELPPVVGAVLWPPLASTLVLPALLLSFFLCFPGLALRSVPAWVAIWMPALVVGGRQLWVQLNVVYRQGADRLPVDWFGWRWGVWIGYLCAAAVVALVRLHRSNPTERRRLSVMALGGGLGAVAGGPVALAFWRGSETTLFTSPAVAFATLSLLVVPLSFTYAILRHRLFDVRFIIRQGVRYALARRLLLSIVPALVVIMGADAYWHRDRSIGQQFAARAPVYGVLAVLALVAARERQRWLDALDRWFFRERYDAQRLLRRVVEQVRRADGLPEAASLVVDQVEHALHPRFVTLLARAVDGEAYRALATAPPSSGPTGLPADLKLAALARVLGEPLDVSATGAGWLSTHLPPPEVALVEELGLEMLVPIDGGQDRPAALLALGSRRSEEPYAGEDRQLLWTIAQSLAVLERRDGRGPVPPASFEECPRCGSCYDPGTATCAADGEALTAVALPRVLSGRYRLERRLGRGGMGVVYAASDVSLARPVAVKVVREDLVHDRESARRFEREARVSAMFTHPNVVTVHDFGVASLSRAFLVMERLEGTTLRDEIDRGPLAVSRVLAIMRGVCAAVDAAHRRQLIHRDLKPENVFLARDDGAETPKILDFGIAKVFAGGPAPLGPDTTVGVMIGTPRYMAPEQLRGGPPEPSWDVWAIALMTYEMLTASHPFATLAVGLPGASPPVLPATGLEDSRLRASWQSYFARWFSPDPAGRPASARAFLDELERMLERER